MTNVTSVLVNDVPNVMTGCSDKPIMNIMIYLYIYMAH